MRKQVAARLPDGVREQHLGSQASRLAAARELRPAALEQPAQRTLIGHAIGRLQLLRVLCLGRQKRGVWYIAGLPHGGDIMTASKPPPADNSVSWALGGAA